MTDNGLAALAAALIKGSYLNGSWFDHEEECAAAILGERGAFLPDGLPQESCDPPCADCCREHPHWSHLHSDQFGARPPTVRETLERLGLPQTTGRIPPEIVHPAPFAEDNPYNTIATLRAALDGLGKPMGEWLVEMMERNMTPPEATLYDALRAALATATKETP